MNPTWKEFLLSRNLAPVDAGTGAERLICPATDLGILSVSGRDAETFLQGQTTCDMRTVGESVSSLGAICNPKGRVIVTFRAIRKGDSFWLLVPSERLEAVTKRLKLYVLRADVALADVSAEWCPFGVWGENLLEPFSSVGLELPERADHAVESPRGVIVRIRCNRERCLVIATADSAPDLWRQLCRSGGFAEYDGDAWRREEVLSGIPWVTAETGEEFVPQMLNLDLLGGIGFTKGCYTGQEIVARMHYLGHLKRRMFLLHCAAPPAPGTPVFDAENPLQQSVGTVVQATPGYALAVLQIAHAAAALRLGSPDGEPVRLADQPYAVPTAAEGGTAT